MSEVALSQGVTHFELAGPDGGAPVVLLHGGSTPMWTWDAYVPELASAGYRVLRYDMFGRGESGFPPGSHDRALFRGQLLELLEKVGMRGGVNLVGYSFGGATAISFASCHPERVRSLAMIAPAMFYERGNTAIRVLRIPWIGPAFLRLFGMGRLRSIARDVVAGMQEPGAYEHLFGKQLEREGFRRAFLSFSRSDALGDYRPFLHDVGGIDRPMLLVWGEDDAVVPETDMADVRAALPGLQYTEMRGADHTVVFSAPQKVLEVLLPFLEEGAEEKRGDAHGP